MSKKTKKEVEAMIAEVRKTSKDTGSTGNSRGILCDIATGILNCPDYEMPNFKVGKDGSAEKFMTQPAKEFRTQTANVVSKTLGLDKADTQRLEDEMEFTPKFAGAMVDVTDAITGEYLSTGRAKLMPTMAEDQARMMISIVTAPEKTSETSKIVKNEAKGIYESVPTGKIVTTKEHQVLKVKNGTRPWQKITKDK